MLADQVNTSGVKNDSEARSYAGYWFPSVGILPCNSKWNVRILSINGKTELFLVVLVPDRIFCNSTACFSSLPSFTKFPVGFFCMLCTRSWWWAWKRKFCWNSFSSFFSIKLAHVYPSIHPSIRPSIPGCISLCNESLKRKSLHIDFSRRSFFFLSFLIL